MNGMRYKVVFQFMNERGEWKDDTLTNNGKGFTIGAAEDIARQLSEHSIPTRRVSIENCEVKK